MAEDVNEGIENALSVIVSTTGSSGNMKKELKTIFDTVSTLRKLFVKLIDTNESYARLITELEQQVANTNAVTGEGTERANNYIAVPSSVIVRNNHGQTGRKETPPGRGKANTNAGTDEGTRRINT